MAAHTVLVVIEGVLADDQDDDLLRAQPIEAGFKLFAGLQRAGVKLVICSRYPRETVQLWLMHGSSYTIPYTPIEHVDGALPRLRAAGNDVLLYIDSDGDRCVEALREGVTTMLFAKPMFARLSHRLDVLPEVTGLRRAWSDMANEMGAQKQSSLLESDA